MTVVTGVLVRPVMCSSPSRGRRHLAPLERHRRGP